MLVLTRRVNEKVIIGDGISITVLDIQSGQVRLGIRAPKGISVHREEVYKKIKEQSDACEDNT